MQQIIIEGNSGKPSEVKKIGQYEYMSWSMACSDRRNKDKPATWYTVNVFKDDRSTRALANITKGSLMRVTGNLQVTKGDKGTFLDIYAPLEMVSFMGRGSQPDGASGAKFVDKSAPQTAAADDGNDIPF